MSIPTIWLRAVEEDKYSEFETYLRNSSQYTNTLLRILQEKAQMIEKPSFQEEDYTKPELTHRMAFRNGKLSAYYEIAELLLPLTKKEI